MLLGEGVAAEPLVDHRQVVAQLGGRLLVGRRQGLVIGDGLFIERCGLRLALAEIEQGGELGAHAGNFRARHSLAAGGDFQGLATGSLGTGGIAEFALDFGEQVQTGKEVRQGAGINFDRLAQAA